MDTLDTPSALAKVKRFVRGWYAKYKAPAAGEPQPMSERSQAEARKLEYARVIFRNGSLPTDFSITIGVAPCNYSCRFCPQSVNKPKKALWLDLQLLEKCLNEMPEEKVTLNVSSFSETLAAPNLVESIRLMKRVRPKLPIVMATNGSLFREKVITELIDAGLDHYSYSFDAATRESYQQLIQVDNFDKAWRNLEQIVELRNRKQSSMRITTHIMHFQGVEQDFERFKAYWQDKVDGVVLRSVGNWGGGDSLNLTQRLEQFGFVSAHANPERRYPCNSIFTHFILEPDGHYMPCIGTVPGYASDLRYSLGHARDTTWSEAWERLSTMRAAHMKGDWNQYEACRNCNLWSLWQDSWFEDADSAPGTARFRIPGVEFAK
jgi:radical SAM protein with 4Fe4S-binding SPASM domain